MVKREWIYRTVSWLGEFFIGWLVVPCYINLNSTNLIFLTSKLYGTTKYKPQHLEEHYLQVP